MSLLALGLLAAAAVVLVAPPRGAGAGSSVPALVRDRVARAARGRGAGQRRERELEWLDAMAAELVAGRDPVSALLAADRGCPLCPKAVAAARAGAEVAPALLLDAGESATLRSVAACWEVASSSGAGLASSLTVLADAARESERVRAELVAGLAEPRATAVVLACLPVLGLLLGSMLGADPWQWLTSSALGAAVLVAGVLLELAGAWWSWRIAASLEARL